MRRGGSSSGQVIVAKLPEHLSIRKVTSMPSLRRKERCGRSVRTRYSAAPLTDEMVLYHEEGAFDRWDGGERTEKQEWSAEGCFRTTACTLAEGHKIFFWMKKSMRKQARPTPSNGIVCWTWGLQWCPPGMKWKTIWLVGEISAIIYVITYIISRNEIDKSFWNASIIYVITL